MWKDYSFIVKCNDGPSFRIDTVADNYDKAKQYVKEIYAEHCTTYADDRFNNWSIKEV